MNRYEIYDRTLEWAYKRNAGKPLNTVDIWWNILLDNRRTYRVVINAHPDYKWIDDPKQRIGPFEIIVFPSSNIVTSYMPIIIASPNGVSLWQRDEARRFSRMLDKTMKEERHE